ncbi:POL4 protein, partial [Pseudoatta argentina]
MEAHKISGNALKQPDKCEFLKTENADALSRNSVDVEETNCNIINHHKPLNLNDPKDAETISKMLEELDEENEEDEDFKLYLTDDEPLEDLFPDDHPPEEDTNSTSLTRKETEKPREPQTMENTITHNIPQSIIIKCSLEAKQQKIEIPSRISYPEISHNKRMRRKEKEKLKGKTGPIIINDQIIKNNILDSRDLLFLRKDNVAYFVDTNGRSLDSGSQKLFERNEIPRLEDLALGKAKVVKYKKYYHLAFPISEGQREGPTMTFTQISAVIKDLRFVTEELKLETISIAKTGHINNVPWSNIKTALQLVFVDSSTNLIICNGLVKYLPKDLRSTIIGEMHCLPTGGHRGVTKTYNRIKHKYHWENLKSDVQRYIQQCLQCQLKKLVRQPMIITDTPGSSFDKVAMDIVGPLLKTRRGNEYILTLQDQLTKFCIGIPLSDQTSETIAEAFVNRFICVLAAPEMMLASIIKSNMKETLITLGCAQHSDKLRAGMYPSIYNKHKNICIYIYICVCV